MESPFRERFNTNYVPEDAEIQRIRSHLAPHEAELARLESLIRDLNVQIKALTVQRDRVKDYIDPHRAIISHPRRLPQDILEQIFLACLPTRHNTIMSVLEAPLLLGRICSAWRAIAFATPRLWTTLHISAPFVDEKEERKAAMVEWLQRSDSLPIVLSVMYDYDGWEAPKSVMTASCQVATRWHTLNICSLTSSDFLHRLAAVDAPQLANIHIAFGETFEQDDGLHVLPSTIFRALPRVTITALKPGQLVPTTPFTWNHLTHLNLYCRGSHSWEKGLSFNAAYRLLKGCPRMKALKFHLASDDEDEWVQDALLVPFLESLTIFDRYYTVVDLASFIQCLTMPQLTQFHAGGLGDSKYSPLISDLRLHLVEFAATSLVETFQQFPCLTTLDLTYQPTMLDDDSDPTDLFVFLTPSPPAPNPLPALKELNTRGCRVENTTLIDFLEKQLKYGTNLRDLHLTLYSDPLHAIPDTDIQSFATRGLRVSLEYYAPSHRWRGILPVGRSPIMVWSQQDVSNCPITDL
ncbi:hypothetical protein MVEN_00205200 [Mycena venus]|uniref:F-box domain-containing protein n=1 Tax=Mycena venus TaxID=2733690 RepID=A0A8H7DEQ3_9AGAR|nr:hypothetical protein MVEN_00205200 [Mycena venus]